MKQKNFSSETHMHQCSRQVMIKNEVSMEIKPIKSFLVMMKN